jgi:hypothetical protein
MGLPIEKQGVLVSRLEAPSTPPSPVVQATPGDWILQTESLRLVVANTGLVRAPRGAIVDAVVQDSSEDELVELSPVLKVGGAEIPLQTRHIEPLERHGRPVLRIERRSADGQIGVWTEIGLSAGRAYASIWSRVYNMGQETLPAVQLGDRVRWPGSATFAPGRGFVGEPSRARARWIGRPGKNLSYALVWPEAEAEITSRFEPHGPLDDVALAEAVELTPGSSFGNLRHLVVLRGDLAAAAAVAWTLLKEPLAPVKGRVVGGPGTVEAAKIGEGPTLIVETDPQGGFNLFIPQGAYRITARTAGGEDVQPIEVAAGEPPLELELLPPRPGHLRVRITDGRGRPLPARMVIRGVWPTRDPVLGPPHLASGAGNIVYTSSGEAEVALPQGQFHITVTRGIEYGIAREGVSISPGKGTSLRVKLDREVDTIGWIATELHLHAAPSPDSEVSLEDRVASLVAEGIEFAVATDHNHVTDYGPVIRQLGAERGLRTATGVEVTTWSPPWGHFNVFPYPTEIEAPPYAAMPPRLLFPMLRERAPGALIQVNHPRMDHDIGYFNRAGLDPATGAADPDYSPDFDSIEVINGMDLGRPESLARNLSDWFALLNHGRRYTATGSSDSHRLIYQWAGYPRTYVQVRDDRPEATTVEELTSALKSGRALVTTGPFVVVRANGGGPGDLAPAPEGQVGVQVAVRAARWIDVSRLELVVNGQTVATYAPAARPGAVDRALWQHELSLERDAWLVVIARGERPLSEVLPHSRGLPIAITNPIFLDVDGDGRFRAVGERDPEPPE